MPNLVTLNLHYSDRDRSDSGENYCQKLLFDHRRRRRDFELNKLFVEINLQLIATLFLSFVRSCQYPARRRRAKSFFDILVPFLLLKSKISDAWVWPNGIGTLQRRYTGFDPSVHSPYEGTALLIP